MVLDRRVKPLDGIRGLAILAVMGFHFAFEVAPGGAFGVDLFFVLSGFLITGILLREHRATGRVDMASFYVRRAARLLPALVLFLAVVAPVVAWVIGTWQSIPLNTLATALYLSDFGQAGYFPFSEPYGHTWSLAVEEQFYLVWPALLILVLRARVRLIPFGIGLFVFSAVIMWVGAIALGVGQNYFLPTGHLPSLAIGCLGAFVLDSGPQRLVAALENPWFAWAGTMMFVAMVVLPRQGWPFFWQQASMLIALPFIGCLLLHSASGIPSRLNRGLSALWLRWFGTRSYGLYLYHTALYYLFSPMFVPVGRLLNSVLALAVSLAVAEISYRFVEVPIIEKGRQWSQRRRMSQRPDFRGEADAAPS